MKTVCVSHSIDIDGWMSSAIVKLWFINQYDSKVIHEYDDHISNTHNSSQLYFIGYNYGDEIPDLSEYDKVIMCDISFPISIMCRLSIKLGNNFIWLDHHISAIIEGHNYNGFEPVGIRDTSFAACELTWKWFFPNEETPELVRLLGRYDCFGHKQVWKSVLGYEKLYEVSNHGNVRSLDRIITENKTGKNRLVKGINLSIANSKRGYRVVVLWIGVN